MAIDNMQPLVFPVRGLHEGVGYDLQPPGTTSVALNVRAYDALLNRLRGGRRAGLSKFLDEQINGSAAVQAITKVTRATSGSLGADGAAEDEDLDILALPTSGENLGAGWLGVIRLGESLFGGATAAATNNPTKVAASSPFPAAVSVGANTGATNAGILAQRKSTNTVSATFSVLPQADGTGGGSATANTANGQDGPANGFTRAAVFVRVNPLGNEVIAVYFRYNGSSNTVRWYVSSTANSTPLDQYSDPTTYTLSGDTAPVNLTISVTELSSTQLRVQVSAPNALTGPADLVIDQTVTVNTLNDADNVRSGAGLFRANTTATRLLTALTVETIEQSGGTTVRTVDRNDANPVGGSQYFIPAGVTSVALTTFAAGTPTSVAGPAQDSVITFTPNAGVIVDATNNVVLSNLDSTATAAGMLVDTVNPPTRRIPAAQTGTQVLRANPSVCFYTRVSDDFRSFIKTKVTGTRDASTGMITVSNVNIYVVSNGTTVSGGAAVTFGLNGGPTPPIKFDDVLALVDEGDNGDTAFRLTVNGTTFFEWEVDETIIGIANAPGLYDSTGVSWRRVGAGPEENASNGEIHRVLWLEGGLSPTGGVETAQALTTETSLIAVAGGEVFRIRGGIKTTPGGGLTANPHRVQVQPAYNRVFMVDGSASLIYNLEDDTLSPWAATQGTLLAGARLVCLYRGRLVTAGFVSDPHNWTMSASGDPFDYDYSPAITTATQAVAGNNSNAGLVGDIITTLIAHSDDTLIFGGDSSIYRMTGDPAAGGTIDLVTDQIGMVFGSSWAKDPEGTLYFQAPDGIYRMSLTTGKPESLTLGRLDKRFESIDFNTTRALLRWDTIRKGLMVQLCTSDRTTQNVSLFWEQRTDAWWTDSYPATMGPECMYMFDGNDADDQAFLLGCRDGYIRKVDDAADDDDGTDITSYVRYQPYMAANHGSEVVLNEVLPILGHNSTDVYMEVYTGQSAEGCVTSSTPVIRRLLGHAGRNRSMRQKVRGYCVQLGISHTGSARWAVEGMTVAFEASGKPRRENRG